MSKSRVPISWASRLMFNKSGPIPSHHHPMSSPFLFRQNPNQAPMGATPLTQMLEKFSAPNRGFLHTDKSEERPAVGNHSYLIKRELLPMYSQAYETCFQNRMFHSLVDRTKQLDNKPAGKWEGYSSVSGTAEQKTEGATQANVLRPLSPHLPVYQPQKNSILSILNRVSGSFLTLVVTSFYLVYLKLGPVCLSFENFYQFLFYSSKLTLYTVELTVLAFIYHVYAGVRHLMMDFSGSLIGKAGKKK